MSFLESILLGLIQGVTEFLPVSSDGHLAVLARLYGMNESARVPFTVMLHVATALAMIVFFMPVIVRLIGGLWAADPARRKQSWQMVLFILLASIPAALVGYKLGDWMESALSTPLLLGLMFIVTGAILFGTRYARNGGALNWWRALLVGVAQALGIVPSISRSGATIAMGMYTGMDRGAAFEFSFLLAIPAILGAFVLELHKHASELALVHSTYLAAGMLVAFVSGVAALYLLRRAVLSRRLHWFAYYCWAVGLAVILFLR